MWDLVESRLELLFAAFDLGVAAGFDYFTRIVDPLLRLFQRVIVLSMMLHVSGNL